MEKGLHLRHCAGKHSRKQKGIAVFFEVLHILDTVVARALAPAGTGTCHSCKAPSDICESVAKARLSAGRSFPQALLQEIPQEVWWFFLCLFLSRKMLFTFKELGQGLAWGTEIGSCCPAIVIICPGRARAQALLP